MTGTLNPGAHPGSYNSQDAYNDLLIPDDAVIGTLGARSRFGAQEGACGQLLAHSLSASHDASEDGSGRGTPIIPFDTTQITSKGNRSNPKAGDACHTMSKGAHAPAIATFMGGQGAKAGSIGYNSDSSPTLRSAQSGSNLAPNLQHGKLVRRLTPVECERLQGFRPNYTRIFINGKPAADSPRYCAIGNSWPVPVVRWIGARMQLVEAILRGCA